MRIAAVAVDAGVVVAIAIAVASEVEQQHFLRRWHSGGRGILVVDAGVAVAVAEILAQFLQKTESTRVVAERDTTRDAVAGVELELVHS